MDREAEAELIMSLKLYEAKMRRIEKAQAGKRHGSPYLELERIYKAQLELTQAKAKRAEVEADANNAEANWLAQQCRVHSVLRTQNCVACCVSMGITACACENDTF